MSGEVTKRNGIKDARWASVVATIVAYAVAAAIAIAAAAAISPPNPLAAVAIADGVATLVVFAASVIANNSSMYDPYWSLAPAAIVIYYWWSRYPALGVRELAVGCLLLVYSARLTGNFYRGWPGLRKEDFRYAGLRRRSGRWYWPVSLAGIHLFPTAAVYLACLPLYGAMAHGGPAFGWLDVVAALVVAGAVVTAFVADEQLRRFRMRPGGAQAAIRTGLWRFSRHPNYLGEIATWWGVYLFALAAGANWWWTGIGAVVVTLMFAFISVPMMERRAQATRVGYEDYRSRTPMLLPLGFNGARRGIKEQAE